MPSPLEQLFSLAGRVALVTGSARGLGFEMARGLAGAGAVVYLNGRDPERAARAAQTLAAEQLDVRALPFDVTNDGACVRALETIGRVHGRLDILVNNVGARLRVPLDETTTDGFRALIETDLTAAFALTKRAAELMKPNGYGRIIMVSSVAARLAVRGNIAYSAAKAGLASLARSFAAEYGAYGITANTLSPGRFTTETNTEGGQSNEAQPVRVLLGRWGRPAEITGACVFLASDAASYVTGADLVIDGGASVAT